MDGMLTQDEINALLNGMAFPHSTAAASRAAATKSPLRPPMPFSISRLQEESLLNRAVNRACELMKRCTCGGAEGKASCYACLRNYRNQKYHDILDRSLAWHYFERL